MLKLEGEDGFALLRKLFAEYDLSEYEAALAAAEADYERVCKENRELRETLRKGVKTNVA